MTDISELRFYATEAHPCSYLPGEKATTLFLDPEITLEPALYSELSNHGFRRSGTHVYRPHCQSCQACIPIRVDVSQFKPSRNKSAV